MNAHHKPDAAPVLLREDAGGIATLTLNRWGGNESAELRVLDLARPV